MIGKILIGKVITGIAYSLLGSEVVKNNLTVENARKVASVLGRAAIATGRGVRREASNLRTAVTQRKEELKRAKSDEDSLI